MPDQPATVVLEFAGRANTQRDHQVPGHLKSLDATEAYEVIPSLNQDSLDIAAEIRDRLSGLLPPGVSVDVQIEFRHGSIEWAGVILVLDWMARLSGSVALLEYLKRSARVAIDQVVRRHLQQRGVRPNTDAINTSVSVAASDGAPQPVPIVSASHAVERATTGSEFYVLLGILSLNMIASISILIILLLSLA